MGIEHYHLFKQPFRTLLEQGYIRTAKTLAISVYFLGVVLHAVDGAIQGVRDYHYNFKRMFKWMGRE